MAENLLFTNSFGTISDQRIILNYKKGPVEIKTKEITTISGEHKRSWISAIAGIGGSIFILLFSLFNLSSIGPLELPIIGLIIIIGFLGGVAGWIGHHNIIISTANKHYPPLKIELSKRKQGLEFVRNARKAIKTKNN